ncbi:hypothetical protein, partial [Pseudomonas viridiflava]|uniref:hypothetical protein n=1 Tax=Pseudomonas viridiflava TaxID=33069 RepID=UPI0019811B03
MQSGDAARLNPDRAHRSALSVIHKSSWLTATMTATMIVPTLCAHRYTQVLLEESDDDRSYAPRGNAAQDAPRPLLNVAQMRGQA